MRHHVTLIAPALGALAIALGAPTAAADSQIPTDRMGATASFQSHGEKFRLWDTACDGNAVYIKYQRSGASVRRLSFNGGCHKMALFDRNFTEGQQIHYTVCVDIPFDVDQCFAGWRYDRT
jgi:hypothetical protein